MPTILEDGAVRVVDDIVYSIYKLGRRLEQRVGHDRHHHHQGIMRTDVQIGHPVWMGNFRTSYVQGIYIHGMKEYEELLYPLIGIFNNLEDLPQTKGEIEYPELEDGDMILATDNSIYALFPQRNDEERLERINKPG